MTEEKKGKGAMALFKVMTTLIFLESKLGKEWRWEHVVVGEPSVFLIREPKDYKSCREQRMAAVGALK